jgi:hypothetical protein
MATTSLNSILATRARASFPYRINFNTILYGNISIMEDWCREHCQGLWRNHNVHALYFQFEDEKDATMFMLRWGSAEGNRLK